MPGELQGKKKSRVFTAIQAAVLVLLWGGLLIFLWINRAKISVESIVDYVPGNTVAAIAVLLMLFALKSMLIVVYGGVLYAASGLLFPLPTAILVNIAGTVLMTGIPFFIGKRVGAKLLNQIVQKNERLRRLQAFEKKNEFFISLAVRMIGHLPNDLVGMYLGASNFRTDFYFLGAVLGMLPSILTFSVMGMSAHDASSPIFWIAAGIQLIIIFLSLAIYLLWKRSNGGGSHNEPGARQSSRNAG